MCKARAVGCGGGYGVSPPQLRRSARLGPEIRRQLELLARPQIDCAHRLGRAHPAGCLLAMNEINDGSAMFELQLELRARLTGRRPLITQDDLVDVHALLDAHQGDLKSLLLSQA